jgi:hypothetical protein
MVATMTSVLFFVSGPVAVLCFAILISGVCPQRIGSSERDVNRDLLFVSDYISLCLQSSVFNAVPWVLAASVNVSSLCVLASWQAYNLKTRQYTLAVHMLVFHFCLSVACVVEFRTDGTASVENHANVGILRVFGTEAVGHKIAAVQAIIDFAVIHLIVSINICNGRRSPRDANVDCQMLAYRALEGFYGVFAYFFLLCWFLQSMIVAAVFEWSLVLCAISMQWYCVHRGAYASGDQTEGNHLVQIFSEHWMITILSVYILLNLLIVVVFTPPRWIFGVDAERYSAQPDALVYTGGEFWLLLSFSTCVVVMSIWVQKSTESRPPVSGPERTARSVENTQTPY